MATKPDTSETQTPQHFTSFEQYVEAIQTRYNGADFSRHLTGDIRMHAVDILAQDIPRGDHAEPEAVQLVRDICVSTTRKIETGQARILEQPDPRPVRLPDGAIGGKQANHDAVRLMLARRIEQELESRYGETDIAPAAQAWAGVARQVAEEFGHEVGVSDTPRLLPSAVEVVPVPVDLRD